MLTHTHAPLDRLKGGRDPAQTGAAATYTATAKRFCMGVLLLLAAASALVAVVALKVAIYLPRSIYH